MVYMKSDKQSLLSVSRAVMRTPGVPGIAKRAEREFAEVPPDAGIEDEEDVRTSAEPVGAPLVDAEDDLPPEVVGVRQGAFQWRSRASLRSVPGGAATRTPHVLVSLGEGTYVPLAAYPIWIGEVPRCMSACMRPSSWLGRHSRKTCCFLDCGR